MAANNRDFIDFLIELFVKRRIFYLILFILLSYATYFNLVENDEYKYQTTIKISPESHLVPIINNINVYNTSADVYLNPLKVNVDCKILKDDLCDLIKGTFVDRLFIDSLTDDYIKKNKSDITREEIRINFEGALKILPNDGTSCVNVGISSTEDYIHYMKKYYTDNIHTYLEDEISKRLALIRNGKIEFLRKSLDSTKTSVVDPERVRTLGQLELNALEERQVVVLSKLELVENTEIVDTNVGFFIYKSSDIGKTLNYIFLYAFAIFMSLIIFVLTIVLIDFKSQFNSREASEN